MHLTDETIQKLSKELQPTIDELKRCLERSELNKTQALSVLMVLFAMYLSHVANVFAHDHCEHSKAEKLAGKLAGRTLLAAGPMAIASCLTEWSLEIPSILNRVNAMAVFDAEVAKHHT